MLVLIRLFVQPSVAPFNKYYFSRSTEMCAWETRIHTKIRRIYMDVMRKSGNWFVFKAVLMKNLAKTRRLFFLAKDQLSLTVSTFSEQGNKAFLEVICR